MIVIEMLLNSDIQTKNCSNDFTLSKRKINVIMYIIEFVLKLNHFIWTKFQ